jgi:hypothetical protein
MRAGVDRTGDIVRIECAGPCDFSTGISRAVTISACREARTAGPLHRLARTLARPSCLRSPNSGERARERGATTGPFGECCHRSSTPAAARGRVGAQPQIQVRSAARPGRPIERDATADREGRASHRGDRRGAGVPRLANSTGSSEPALNVYGVPPDASRAGGRPLGSPEPPEAPQRRREQPAAPRGPQPRAPVPDASFFLFRQPAARCSAPISMMCPSGS